MSIPNAPKLLLSSLKKVDGFIILLMEKKADHESQKKTGLHFDWIHRIHWRWNERLDKFDSCSKGRHSALKIYETIKGTTIRVFGFGCVSSHPSNINIFSVLELQVLSGRAEKVEHGNTNQIAEKTNKQIIEWINGTLPIRKQYQIRSVPIFMGIGMPKLCQPNGIGKNLDMNLFVLDPSSQINLVSKYVLRIPWYSE